MHPYITYMHTYITYTRTLHTYIHNAHTHIHYKHTCTHTHTLTYIKHTHIHSHNRSVRYQQTATSHYHSPFNSQAIRCQHNSYHFTSTLRQLKQSASVSIHRDKSGKCCRKMWASVSAKYFLFCTAWRTDVRLRVCVNRERASLNWTIRK